MNIYAQLAVIAVALTVGVLADRYAGAVLVALPLRRKR